MFEGRVVIPGTPSPNARRGSREGGSSSRRGDAPLAGAETLIKLLPSSYLQSTSEAEKVAHFELFKQFQAEGAVSLKWNSMTMQNGHPCVALHMCFGDTVGSLNAITHTLTEIGISAYKVSAFCTTTGIAIDSFQVSHFDEEAANVLVERLKALAATRSGKEQTAHIKMAGGADALARRLPADYTSSTTAANRLVHLELFRRYGDLGDDDSEVLLVWEPKPDCPDQHVLLHLVFKDCIGSLSTITATLAERGINLVRVAAFSTDTGVAIDMLELSLFERESAGVLQSRLRHLIAEQQEGEGSLHGGGRALAWPGGSAIAFYAVWRGTMGGKRGQAGELAIGPDWFAIGQTSLEAPALTFLQADFKDASTLHLGFLHKRKQHTVAIQFPAGAEHCKRAQALLSRFKGGDQQQQQLQQQGPPTLSALGASGGSFGSLRSCSFASQLDSRDQLPPSQATPLPTPTPAERHSGKYGGGSSGRPHFCAHTRMYLQEVAASLVERFELTPLEAPRTRIGRRFSCLIIATLLVTLLTVGLHWRSSRDWRLFRTAFHPASCTVLGRDLTTEYRYVDRQECKWAEGGSRSCSKEYFIVRARWDVNVKLLGRYLDPTSVDNQPELGDTPPPATAFNAVALPTLHPHHEFAKPLTLAPGVCAGEVNWERNASYTWCLEPKRAAQWLPNLVVGGSYFCKAETHRTDEVFFDVEPTLRLRAESALLWLLLSPIATASLLLCALVACDRMALLCGQQGPPTRGAGGADGFGANQFQHSLL